MIIAQVPSAEEQKFPDGRPAYQSIDKAAQQTKEPDAAMQWARLMMTSDEYRGYLRGAAFKGLSDGTRDGIKVAIVHLQKLLEVTK